MATATVPGMDPWWNVPRFADTGQRRAFVNRELLLTDLVARMVSVGNALRRGDTHARERIALTGYRGVGKSAVLLHAIDMLRAPSYALEGNFVKLPPTLPSPLDPERWLIVRVSGKSVGSFIELPHAIEKSAFATLYDATGHLHQQGRDATQLPWFDRALLNRRDAALYQRVRSEISKLAGVLGEVDGRLGYTRLEKDEGTRQNERSGDLKATIEGSLKGRFSDLSPDAVELGAKSVSEFLRRYSSKDVHTETIEGKTILSADLVVTAFNEFFAACREARLPTVLALDDFDEFASAAGPDPAGRARVLSRVLGAFATLSPTVLVLALREEYRDLDVDRQFMVRHVPPMSRASAREAVRAWAMAHEPTPSDMRVAELQAYSDRLLQSTSDALNMRDEDAIVTPFHHLQTLFNAANRHGPSLASTKPSKVIEEECRLTYSPRTVRTILRVVDALSPDDVRAALEHEPIDAAHLTLSDTERRELQQHGLVTPVMAGEPEPPQTYLDPLFGMLGLARR